MKATDVLMEEHRVIERVIAVLEKAAEKLEQGQAVRTELFIEAADFIQGFADGCHHRKEEGVLFKSLEDHGMPVQGSPVGVMLMEHYQARFYTRNLRSAALQLAGGDSNAAFAVIKNAREYALLLRQHIQKEDQILFPMANRIIPPEFHDRVWQGFEHVEHAETGEGVHEKYLTLAEKLATEMGV